MSLGRWLRNRPRFLELSYDLMLAMMRPFRALSVGRELRWLDFLMRPIERVSKGIVFDCRMCGQCVLHSTGMTCPMSCPKNLRNGPCGGVRTDGNCEVLPDEPCIWVEAFERSLRMGPHGPALREIRPPLDWARQGSAATVTELRWPGEPQPESWSSEAEE
ncbi:MAG TPA: methylenetetrahydrofolate reductase C-terminal domain-containing protein [Acidobacteriota bacterium]|nr:methylenetetrahydrofolate reductase C-terminal domain-containing protein [Acidobacteriota bacterium]